MAEAVCVCASVPVFAWCLRSPTQSSFFNRKVPQEVSVLYMGNSGSVPPYSVLFFRPFSTVFPAFPHPDAFPLNWFCKLEAKAKATLTQFGKSSNISKKLMTTKRIAFGTQLEVACSMLHVAGCKLQVVCWKLLFASS